jgi:hypothetical protein
MVKALRFGHGLRHACPVVSHQFGWQNQKLNLKRILLTLKVEIRLNNLWHCLSGCDTSKNNYE